MRLLFPVRAQPHAVEKRVANALCMLLLPRNTRVLAGVLVVGGGKGNLKEAAVELETCVAFPAIARNFTDNEEESAAEHRKIDAMPGLVESGARTAQSSQTVQLITRGRRSQSMKGKSFFSLIKKRSTVLLHVPSLAPLRRRERRLHKNKTYKAHTRTRADTNKCMKLRRRN